MTIATKYLPESIIAITLYPFVFVNKKYPLTQKTITHEKIHLRQQLELLVLPFYILYLAEYLVRLINYRDSDLAYRNISFEREAYKNDDNEAYLKVRPFWNFKKYF